MLATELQKQIESYFESKNLYYGHGTDCAKLEAEYLLLLGKGLTEDAIWEKAKLRAEENIPLPYVFGKCIYYGMEFYVNKHTLIPRSSFGEVILEQMPFIAPGAKSILDLCTGSGVLALLLEKVFPEAKIVASDISKEALLVAERNIELHSSKIELVHSDLFTDIEYNNFDLIITNPPYVPTGSYENLPKEYYFEPKLALTAGSDGLELCDKILSGARKHLAENGRLLVELGEAAANFIARKKYNNLTWIETEGDLLDIFMVKKGELKELDV